MAPEDQQQDQAPQLEELRDEAATVARVALHDVELAAVNRRLALAAPEADEADDLTPAVRRLLERRRKLLDEHSETWGREELQVSAAVHRAIADLFLPWRVLQLGPARPVLAENPSGVFRWEMRDTPYSSGGVFGFFDLSTGPDAQGVWTWAQSGKLPAAPARGWAYVRGIARADWKIYSKTAAGDLLSSWAAISQGGGGLRPLGFTAFETVPPRSFFGGDRNIDLRVPVRSGDRITVSVLHGVAAQLRNGGVFGELSLTAQRPDPGLSAVGVGRLEYRFESAQFHQTIDDFSSHIQAILHP